MDRQMMMMMMRMRLTATTMKRIADRIQWIGTALRGFSL